MDEPSDYIKTLEPGFQQPADSTTAPDQDQAPAIAAENITPPPEAEIITLDLGDDGMTDRDHWIDRMRVLCDGCERDFLGQLFELQQDVGISLDAAHRTNCPKVMTTHLRNAVTALKSALAVMKELDRHRHGTTQKITVEYSDGNGTSLTLKTPVRDPRFAQSDQMIDELFLAHAKNFGGFESRCRKEVMKLNWATPEELRAKRYGRRPEPDRSTWEIKFRGLASWLAGRAVKFNRAFETRHTRGQQHILVERIGNVPLSKLRTKAVLPPGRAATPFEVCKPTEPAVIFPFAEEMGMEADCATA